MRRNAVGFITSFNSTYAIILALALIGSAVSAEELSIDFDPEKTTVAFVLTDVLHTVRGNFTLKSGRVSIDTSSNGIAGEFVVDAASGKSGNGARDRRMAHEILQAQTYPDIRFVPAKISGTILLSDNSDVQVAGAFLIHGQTHDVTVPMHIRMSQNALSASGQFIVPYVQWGMKNPSNFLLKVNDKVEIHLNAVGRIKK